MDIIMTMTPFRAWSGGIETQDKLEKLGLWDEFLNQLKDLYPEGITETQLNDILWFEDDWVYELMGVDTDEQE